MSILEDVYSVGVRLLQAAFPLLGRGGGKLARGIRGRAGVLRRMREWTEKHRVMERPLVWFHAPSLGEGLQAIAVLEATLRMRPDLQVVYTFFSPSAEGLAIKVPADFADYLPIDTPGAVSEALDLLRPDVIAFSKTDVWPNLTREAKRRGVHLAMISATLPASSSRLRGPARLLLKPAYSRLDRVAAISHEDSVRFGSLGVSAERRSVMGDAHFDRVIARVRKVDRKSALLDPLRSDSPVLVAGSTWASDEERLIPILAGLREQGLKLGTILVPHEPTEAHLAETERKLRAARLKHVLLSELTGPWHGTEILLVDRVGVLGDLYILGALAYVGGGYGTAGLHSVLEPAAFGIPVLFGPYHQNAREAAELVSCGGAFEIGESSALEARIRHLLESDRDRLLAGDAARHFVESGIGAAKRGADVITGLLRESRTETA
ncbi:MAG: hypothetical protein H0U67_10365 [Gemmatimonadetes bacterium]|nr:hypothetical protein [Gemmatimonadota bacterium]